jgi:tetratricopeptide (TPR) repeat protein
MSKLLEILGRAITVDTAELLCQWLNTIGEAQTSQKDHLDDVLKLLDNRKIAAAEEKLRLYLLDNPACTRGRLLAAAVALNENRVQNAIEQLKSVYLRQPSNTMALYALGHCYERLGKQAEAVEFYQDCLKFKNYLQFPRQRLAAVYFKNGQLEKTVNEYEQLKTEFPDDVSTLVTLGHLYIAIAKYDEAIETFNKAILIHPDNYHCDLDQIDQLIQEGELHDALEQVEDMLATDSERADVAVKRADVLAMLGDASEAVEQYQEAIRIRPDFLEANIKLGTQFLQMDQPHLAAKQFNNAFEINDQIVDAYIGLAIAQKLAGAPSDALVTLALAAAIQPNSSLLLAETASLQFQTSFKTDLSYDFCDGPPRLLEAVIEAHRWQILHHSQNPDLHYRLGVLLTSIGKINEAIRAFGRALEINPNFSRAKSKLAVCLLETGRENLALDQLTAPDCLDKDTLELHYKIAMLYCDKIKFASSLINLENLLEKNFTHADATVNVAVVLQNLGLLDRVSAMWDNLYDTAQDAMNAKNF